MPARSDRLTAVAQALLTTAFWSTSFLLLRHALPAVPPMTLAGVRYAAAFLVLLAYALLVDRRRPGPLPWRELVTIGVLAYGAGQASLYGALRFLPVATIVLIFSLAPALQALVDAVWLKEPPTRAQLLGAAVTLAGIALYLPWGGTIAWRGVALMIGPLVASVVGNTLSRRIAREGSTPTLYLTLVSMGAGAAVILPVGLALEAVPRFPPTVLLALLWLALVNTTIAYSLWNHVLRTLTAFEANLIGNTTLFQVGILGWIFLGEPLSLRQITGLVVAFSGVLLAQYPMLRPRRLAR